MKALLGCVAVASAVCAAPYVAAWLLAALARRYGHDPKAVPSGYRYRYVGQDDELRLRSEKRRAEAHALRRDATRLETRDREDRRPRLLDGGRW